MQSCVNQNQLCFVHIFFILVCCTIATRKGFSYRTCDEEMSKSLLVLTLLKIVSQYQWYMKYIDFMLQSIVYLNNISKAVALKGLISAVGLCLQ